MGFVLPWNNLFSRDKLNYLRIKTDRKPSFQQTLTSCYGQSRQFRTIDGSCNNEQNPDFGAASNSLQRLLPAKYYDYDGLNDPLGFPNQTFAPQVPSALDVASNFIVGQSSQLTFQSHFSHALMQWGQWIDHDLDLSIESEGGDECQKNP